MPMIVCSTKRFLMNAHFQHVDLDDFDEFKIEENLVLLDFLFFSFVDISGM